MKELTRRNWHEWIERTDLTWTNWNEWMETHEVTLYELKRMNWNEVNWNAVNYHDWLEMNELKRMNWTEWMTWMNWHEWIYMNEVNWNECSWHRMNWNEMTWKRMNLPKVPRTPQFLTISMWNPALATVSCALCRLHLQKVPKKASVFFTIFMWNRALATLSCTCCRPLSGSSRETAETETLQRQPRTATLPEETQGFAPESVFSREFTRSRSLTLLNYFMMMWLTWWLRWWCSCHDGETASHWETSVIWKFLN